MNRILNCIVVDHDWRWIVAAGLLCVLGIGASFRLLVAGRSLGGPRGRLLAQLGALVGGIAVFSTHFVAMQGYLPGEEVRYALWPTVASLAVGLGSIALATAVVMSGRRRLNRGLGAAVGLSGVAAMHFVGIAALRLKDSIVWDPALAATAVGGGLVISVLAAAVVFGPGKWRVAMTSVTGSLSIIFLHFTAMAALTIEPGQADAVVGPSVSAATMMVVIMAMIAGIIALVGTIVWTGFRSRSAALLQIRQAIDAMPDGMAFYDADDRLVLWNEQYAEVNPELRSNLVPGMTFRQILQIGIDDGLYCDAAGREAEWIAERLAARATLSSTMEQSLVGDRWIRVADRRAEGGGTVTVCTDITDLKRQAAALVEARDAAEAANRAKSQFLANMSHEIRTPLNGIIGISQALAATALDGRQSEMLGLIHSSGRTLQVLLSDILDLARVESGRMELSLEPFDLGRTVREAAQLYEASASDKGLQFFVDITETTSGWCVGDAVRIKQILTNLVSNAVKFTQEGFVSLNVSEGPSREGARTVRFSVEDTGIGFDSATRDRLFSRFEQADGGITRKFGGSGLGLAISRQLAEMMGGALDCESEPGGGSAFILTIPLPTVAAPIVAVEADTGEVIPTGRTIRVLLADDHPVNRKVVEMVLAQVDVSLTAVEDGAQAVEAMRAGIYDLVLMDMQMPVMDGLTATREIRKAEADNALPRTPVVMLTANALPEHIQAAEAAGADRHLAKPFDAAELLSLIADLGRATQRKAAAA